MHIPDGYLSPSTSLVMIAISVPFLLKAAREINDSYRSKSMPLVGVFGSFSFLIMMFNLPLPGGTTGHAVGAVISSLVLGPWVSMIAVSLALIIQALFFGDGGILALGANIFNMAIMMSLVGHASFSFLKKIFPSYKFDSVFAGISGFIAINVAAFLTAFELGLQPLLFKTSTGQALYFPYSLSLAIPSMMIGHLTIAGFAEAFVSFFGFSWIQRQFPTIIAQATVKKTAYSLRPLFIVLTACIVLVPMGLLAPGTAWGEWGRDELLGLGLGFIPQGFDRWSTLWSAPIADYDISWLKNSTVSYILSALLGVVLTLLSVKIVTLLMPRLKHRE